MKKKTVISKSSHFFFKTNKKGYQVKNIFSTPDSVEYENNYISDWRDTASKRQSYSCMYMYITLTVEVHNELFWPHLKIMFKSTMLMWVNDSFQPILKTQTTINNKAIWHVYIQSETFETKQSYENKED